MDALPQFSVVTLTEAYEKDGLSLPAGAVGTIVDVYPDFASYTVEFFDPIRAVETVPMTAVKTAELTGPFAVYLVDKPTGRVICRSEDVAACEQARATGKPYDQTRNIRISFAYGREL